MKCPKCGNDKVFQLEEKNWVTYTYKNKELKNGHEITGSCDEADHSHIYCGKCRHQNLAYFVSIGFMPKRW